MARIPLAALALVLLCAAPGTQAQAPHPPCPWPGPAELLLDRASPPDSALLDLGAAMAKVCYGRPHARGRGIMGELVPYGRTWRMGANEPTLLFLPVAAEVAGVALEPGRYVLLAIPQPDRWTVTLSTSDAAAPMEMFENRVEVGRGTVPVERTEQHVEALTLRGAGAAGDAALVLEWERTRVRIPVRVH